MTTLDKTDETEEEFRQEFQHIWADLSIDEKILAAKVIHALANGDDPIILAARWLSRAKRAELVKNFN